MSAQHGTAHQARRRPAPLAALTALAALALAGCAQLGIVIPHAAPDGPDAEPAPAVDCRTEGYWPDGQLATPRPGEPEIPTPGRVPDGFEAVAALRCTTDFPEPGDPVEEHNIFVERFEGDLDPLLTALAGPDDEASGDVFCPADLELVPPLWLEASDGTLIPVHYPRTVCGKTKPGVHEALDRLEIVERTVIEEDATR
ncbi:hypothetical protein ABIQ69_06550 [Agromyces sp. G08B096]|uniref:DUF3558 domain-containing protein n=1 Tax=Agromyces sp. G08B096 TaxID=3156399 RepID=A0AAU7WAR0_9MICO